MSLLDIADLFQEVLRVIQAALTAKFIPLLIESRRIAVDEIPLKATRHSAAFPGNSSTQAIPGTQESEEKSPVSVYQETSQVGAA